MDEAKKEDSIPTLTLDPGAATAAAVETAPAPTAQAVGDAARVDAPVEKLDMPTPDEVLRLVGHPVGGVCPFGVNDGVEVYIDESVKRFTTVFPAVGSGNSAIELTPEELFKYSKALEWVDVCKLPE